MVSDPDDTEFTDAIKGEMEFRIELMRKIWRFGELFVILQTVQYI